MLNRAHVSSGASGNRAGPQSISVIIRAGHVIAADGTDQLAAARFQTLRADWAIPGNIVIGDYRTLWLVRGREAVEFMCDRRGIDTSADRRAIGSKPCLRSTFHGGDGYSTSSGKGKGYGRQNRADARGR